MFESWYCEVAKGPLLVLNFLGTFDSFVPNLPTWLFVFRSLLKIFCFSWSDRFIGDWYCSMCWTFDTPKKAKLNEYWYSFAFTLMFLYNHQLDSFYQDRNRKFVVWVVFGKTTVNSVPAMQSWWTGIAINFCNVELLCFWISYISTTSDWSYISRCESKGCYLWWNFFLKKC